MVNTEHEGGENNWVVWCMKTLKKKKGGLFGLMFESGNDLCV
jgi:hypothetical protein